MPRYVRPRGELIAALREAKPWTQEYLANAAAITVRTLQSIEASRRCTRYTISAIAEILDRPFADIIIDTGVESDVIEKGSTPVILQLNINFKSLDETVHGVQLLNLIEHLAANSNLDIRILRGSLLLMTELPRYALDFLLSEESKARCRRSINQYGYRDIAQYLDEILNMRVFVSVDLLGSSYTVEGHVNS